MNATIGSSVKRAGFALIAGVVLALAVLAGNGVSEPAPGADAAGPCAFQGDDCAATAMSVDVEETGNTAGTGDDGVIGTIETCRQINENNILDADEDFVDGLYVDIRVDDVPLYNDAGTPGVPGDDYGGIISYSFNLAYDEANLSVQSHSIGLLGARPGSSVSDLSDPVPDTDNSNDWQGGATDVVFYGSSAPEGGDAFLDRLSIESDKSAASGNYPLTLSGTSHQDSGLTIHSPQSTDSASVSINQPCGSPPANDNLIDALEITLQPYTNVQDTTGATVETTGPMNEATAYTGCQGDFADPTVGATVWYKYTHTGATSTLQLDTIGGNLDDVIAVYAGPATVTTFADLSYTAGNCSDAEFGTLGDAGLTFSAVTGTTYYFQLGGYFGGTGLAVLNLGSQISTAGAAYLVTSTADTGDPDATPEGVCDDGFGACTLREAVEEANANIGMDNIRFAISPGGPVTISTSLLSVSDAVNIDGRTQPGFTGAPIVEVSGTAGCCVLGAGSPSTMRGLVVNGGTGGYEMAVHSSNGHVVQGNYLGTDATGTADAGNNVGLTINNSSNNTIGGTTSAARNVISGNDSVGVFVYANTGGLSEYNDIFGNYIGTDATGTAALANGEGVYASTDGSVGSSVAYTEIGTNYLDGTGNVISGNTFAGVDLSVGASSVYVLGNRIGTNAAGDIGLGNGGNGVSTVFGSSFHGIINNVISDNGGAGVRAEGSGHTISANFIGTEADQVTPLGNAGDGIFIDGSGMDVSHNTVTGSGGAGVRVAAGTGNVIYSQTGGIYGNAGLGIDLSPSGITPNDGGPADDADTGPNNLQNFPVVTSATNTLGSLVLKATLDSLPGQDFFIVFYSSPSCDGTHGEGKTWVADAYAVTDLLGEVSVTVGGLAPGTVGHAVTATALHAIDGSTSEFSACRVVEADTDGDEVGDPSDNCPSVANPLQENADGDPKGDACDPCPTFASFWAVPLGDADCDGFTNAAETLIGTNPADPCGFIAGGGTPSEVWPADIVPSNGINIADVSALKPLFNTSVPPTSPRMDIAPGGGINIADVVAIKPFFNKTCKP